MSSASAPARLNMLWAWPALFGVVSLILFFRQPAAILHPGFFAEDGFIFFKQQYETGFTNSLFTPYAGYLHFAPRIVAGLCAFLPIEQIPAAYSIISLIIAALILTFFFAPHFRCVIESDVTRAIVMLVFSLLPNADSLMRLAYLCWYLLFFLALVTLMTLPRSLLARWLLFVPVLLAAWSAPLAIVCVPLILLRRWLTRDRGERLWWLAMLFVIIVFPFTAESTHSLLARALHQKHWPSTLFHAVGYRIFCFFFLGEALAHPMPSVGWQAVNRLSILLAGICLAGAMLSLARRPTPASSRLAPLFVFYLVLACPLLFILRVEWMADFAGWNEQHTWNWHQRYFFASTLLLAVLGGVVFERLLRARIIARPGARVFAAAILLGWVSLHTVRFRLFDWRSASSWKHYTRQIHAAEALAKQANTAQVVHIATAIAMFDFDLVIYPPMARGDSPSRVK